MVLEFCYHSVGGPVADLFRPSELRGARLAVILSMVVDSKQSWEAHTKVCCSIPPWPLRAICW